MKIEITEQQIKDAWIVARYMTAASYKDFLQALGITDSIISERD